MKYAVVFAALFALTACEDDRPSSESKSGVTYYVECIDGIEYWVRRSGYRGYMAVRIDSETMTFVRCGGN